MASPQPATIEAALAILPSLPRPMLSRLVTRMIERIDDIDGEPDDEANGDELDFNAAEDDFCHHSDWRGGAGCPVADPAEEDNEDSAVEDGHFDGEEDYCDGGEDRGTMSFLTDTDLREVRRVKRAARELGKRSKIRRAPLRHRSRGLPFVRQEPRFSFGWAGVFLCSLATCNAACFTRPRLIGATMLFLLMMLQTTDTTCSPVGRSMICQSSTDQPPTHNQGANGQASMSSIPDYAETRRNEQAARLMREQADALALQSQRQYLHQRVGKLVSEQKCDDAVKTALRGGDFDLAERVKGMCK